MQLENVLVRQLHALQTAYKRYAPLSGVGEAYNLHAMNRLQVVANCLLATTLFICLPPHVTPRDPLPLPLPLPRVFAR